MPGTVPRLARIRRGIAALVDMRALKAEYDLDFWKVLVTEALTESPIAGYAAMATRNLDITGREGAYTVYESKEPITKEVRGWWEMPAESGESTGRFVFLLNPGEYDASVDCWPR